MRIPRRQQHLDLVRLQAVGSAASLRPDAESSLRKSLLGQPEPPPIVGKQLDRGLPPSAEHEDAAAERVFLQMLTAVARQAINSHPAIDRFGRHQYPHLWGELEQRLDSQILHESCECAGRCRSKFEAHLAAASCVEQ